MKKKDPVTAESCNYYVLGSFWDRFGVCLGLSFYSFGSVFGSFWIRFGIVLGSSWDRFGIVLGSF